MKLIKMIAFYILMILLMCIAVPAWVIGFVCGLIKMALNSGYIKFNDFDRYVQNKL